jgi:hypothetical protein
MRRGAAPVQGIRFIPAIATGTKNPVELTPLNDGNNIPKADQLAGFQR